LTKIVVHFGNGARYADGYYGTLIGGHRWRINLCQIWWPWVNFDPDFKVTTLLEVKCLKKTVRFMDRVTVEH